MPAQSARPLCTLRRGYAAFTGQRSCPHSSVLSKAAKEILQESGPSACQSASRARRRALCQPGTSPVSKTKAATALAVRAGKAELVAVCGIGSPGSFRSELTESKVSAVFRCSMATFRVPFGSDGRCRLWVAGGWVARATLGAWKRDSSPDSGIQRFMGQFNQRTIGDDAHIPFQARVCGANFSCRSVLRCPTDRLG